LLAGRGRPARTVDVQDDGVDGVVLASFAEVVHDAGRRLARDGAVHLDDGDVAVRLGRVVPRVRRERRADDDAHDDQHEHRRTDHAASSRAAFGLARTTAGGPDHQAVTSLSPELFGSYSVTSSYSTVTDALAVDGRPRGDDP